MSITYPEGGVPGLLLRQKKAGARGVLIDTVRVQLVPLRPAPKAKIGSPKDVVTLVKEMENFDRESAVIIHLDTKNQVMGVETISVGSLSASIVHPRETVKGAILNNSASVIFIHNHPSGVCEPSSEDVEITGRLKEAFELVGIALLDSVIVGKGCYYSLTESGFLSGKGVSTGILKEPSRVREPYQNKRDCMISEGIMNLPIEERRKIAKSLAASTGAAVEPRIEYVTIAQIQKLPLKERVAIARKLASTELTIRENIQAINIDDYLNRRTVDTNRQPVPASAIRGAAVPENGYLVAYHVTDNPEGVMRMLRSSTVLTEQATVNDLGSGFYVSEVPQYWFVRSREKWAFARNLTRAQRQKLVEVILSDPNYRKGGGYLADFEVDYLNRDLRLYIETGDVNILAMTGNQPYNVQVTGEMAKKAGVPVPKMPGMVEVRMKGKFIHAEGLYYNLEIENRAREWAGSLEGRKMLAQWFVAATPKNIVNAWLRSKGYSGAFSKAGMSTNPEMVIWDRRAITDFRLSRRHE